MKRTSNIWLGNNVLAAALMLSGVASAQWLNYPTVGIPRTRDHQPDMDAAAPKTSYGKPDLSGLWEAEDQTYFRDLADGLKPGEVVLTPWATAIQKQREERDHVDDPLARCLPHGVPRVNTNGMFPFKIIQTPTLVVILYEQLGLFRQIFMDGRTLGNDPNPSWLGYSTGRWDGDALVVDTSGFNDKTWLDTFKGRPASEMLHVQERFRRTSFGNMEVRARIDDPKAFTKPWTTTAQKMHLQLNTEILEFSCNENEKDIQHQVVKQVVK
jgi:hypothetical protein